jgi:pyruvate dehydrogenase E2 component (dihydrolipoamide acetyltransferase)
MDVLMPQLGETVAEGKISKWFVKAGDSVKPGQNLFEIETDKVSMEVPAIAAGTLAAIHVAASEIAPVGAVVAQILGAGEQAVSPPVPLVPRACPAVRSSHRSRAASQAKSGLISQTSKAPARTAASWRPTSRRHAARRSLLQPHRPPQTSSSLPTSS